ncbi:acid-sensing ion channel 2-like [Crassostrea angulata]|uniref:acid-sensing ion channel 2-like n=1 Tax=Magallana angulata TaxID=2784310 RepID=UPI0022B093AF|nr:acid-sensing ion channel 2-like [Crassostrea angulata]
MNTNVVKPSSNPLNRDWTISKRSERINITGSMKTNVTSPEVVCDSDNDLNRKEKEKMNTTVVKPSSNTLNRDWTFFKKSEKSVFNITGRVKTNATSREVVCDSDNDLNRKEKNIDDDNCNIQLLWSDFRDNTTMHGLKNANLKQRHRLRCCIWAVAFVAMACSLIYTTFEQVNIYFKYPTILNTHVQTQTSVKFPAVTFCSASPLKKQALPDIPDLEYFFLSHSVIGSNVLTPRLNLSLSEYAKYHLPISASWVKDTANRIEDLFLICKFDGKDRVCKSDMEAIITPVGVCYTFNSRNYVSKNGHIMTSQTGSTSGLLLYLLVNQNSYVYNDIMTAGFKVIIHDQNDEPDVIDKGFFVSQGFSTFASIHKTEYQYLPSPYKMNGDQFCVDTKSPEYKNPLQYYDVYSKTACRMECKQNHVITICGCRSPNDKGNYTMCYLAKWMECYKVESERFDQNGTVQGMCPCPTECEYNEYQARLSTGYFPAKNYDFIFNELGITNIRENLLELVIYFESFGVLKVEQKPEYSPEDILGLLGGQMGLFLGASLLTLTELIEVILLSSMVVGRRMYHRIVKKT